MTESADALVVFTPSGRRGRFPLGTSVLQAARSLGDWTLVGCTVSPEFDFDRFELAPEGWHP